MGSDKTLDLLILDDDPDIGRGLQQKAVNEYSLTTKVFTSGIAAFEYLKSLLDDELPLAYLLDMRIHTDILEDYAREMEAPEEMFNYLNERGKTTFFAYHTGHDGDHDKEVIARTGARMILKPHIEKVKKFLAEIAKAKQGNTEYELKPTTPFPPQ